ncbi:glycosyltransferase family 2 protein [Pseudophaeobacter sp.]|uniref:glycosyltransferase family 2 protein n=1 Tax=Pseudophaeobacter sp. TaxID=1971739 RepID=UPI00329963B3
MKITVVIPNQNGGDFLQECLESVVGQTGVDSEIIVIDGGSVDTSLSIIRRFEGQLAHWESTPDAGPYHAIEKGFAKSTGDILCWLNSDDIMLPGALAEVVNLFAADPEMSWVSGIHSTFLSLQTLRERGYPRSDFFTSDDMRYAVQQYRGIDRIDLTYDYILDESPEGGYFLQQESTFWRRDLWEKVGGFDHRYSLAGDYWLWLEFLSLSPLTLVDRPFGSFRQSPWQRSSEHWADYQAEARSIASMFKAANRHVIQESDGQVDEKTDPVAPTHIKRLNRDALCLVTSIAPVGVEKQVFCMETWRVQGARILSFNTAAEIEKIATEKYDLLAEVEFVEVTETARDVTGKDLVLLRDIVRHCRDLDQNTCIGIINSDIQIDAHVDLAGFVQRTCSGGSSLVSSRVDLDDYWDREGQIFSGGVDAFFFTPDIIADFPMETDFAIGAPWWDYFMVMYLCQKSKNVFYPRPIPFYHKRHTTNYPQSIWLHYGRHFLEHFDPSLVRAFDDKPGSGQQSSFLADIARQYAVGFYHDVELAQPMPWATLMPHGSGFHNMIEILEAKKRQWADRAIMAEEVLLTKR